MKYVFFGESDQIYAMAQLTLTKLYLACIEFNYLAGDSYVLIVQKILVQTK